MFAVDTQPVGASRPDLRPPLTLRLAALYLAGFGVYAIYVLGREATRLQSPASDAWFPLLACLTRRRSAAAARLRPMADGQRRPDLCAHLPGTTCHLAGPVDPAHAQRYCAIAGVEVAARRRRLCAPALRVRPPMLPVGTGITVRDLEARTLDSGAKLGNVPSVVGFPSPVFPEFPQGCWLVEPPCRKLLCGRDERESLRGMDLLSWKEKVQQQLLGCRGGEFDVVCFADCHRKLSYAPAWGDLGSIFGNIDPLNGAVRAEERDLHALIVGGDVDKAETVLLVGFELEQPALGCSVYKCQFFEGTEVADAEHKNAIGSGVEWLSRRNDDQRAVEAVLQLLGVVPVRVVDESSGAWRIDASDKR